MPLKKDSPKKTVYFIRHGQSEGNLSHKLQGLDSLLTEDGRRQAALAAGRFANISFETLISSPLPRAKETAEAITAVTGKEPEFSDLFVERVKPTRIVGKSKDESPEITALADTWYRSLYTPGLRAEDGENFDDLFARADKALEFLRNRKEENLVVVTHGYFFRTMLLRVLLGDHVTGPAFGHFQSRATTQNTGISVLTFGQTQEDDAWRLWVYNDHAHLG